MDKSKILDEFDTLTKAKKQHTTIVKLCLGFALAVVGLVLLWGLRISNDALSKVVVISKSGEYLQTEAIDHEALFSARVQTTCEYLTRYANSFDRQTIKANQARALFYGPAQDLNMIFNKYYTDRAYTDATNNGAVYNCTLEQVEYIKGDTEPYEVRFTSILSINTAGRLYRFRLHSDGKIISTTPRYPENVTGLMFSEITQRAEPLADPTQNEEQYG